MKQCRICKKLKSYSEYGPSKRCKDGRRDTCKPCRRGEGQKLSSDRYQELLTRQGGKCAICSKPEPTNGRKLAADHDHSCCPGSGSCGRCIRGLLCSPCNTGIGSFKENVNTLANVYGYLSTAPIAPGKERSRRPDTVIEWVGDLVKCCDCQEVKPSSEYYLRRSKRPFPYCKSCFYERSWENEIFRDYGCTREQYGFLLERQCGVCAICSKPPVGKSRLSVDHDHTTKMLRGLLCMPCNSGLGYFQDDVTIVERAITYLESFTYGPQAYQGSRPQDG